MTTGALPLPEYASHATARPVLYSFRRCPYAMRARLAITVSGVQCELREIVLRDKPDAMLRASPKGTVPVLVDTDDTVIDQSLDIMVWALRQHDPQGWLRPGVLESGAAVTGGAQEGDGLSGMLALVQHCDTQFKPHLDRYKYPQRYENAGPAEAHRQLALDWLTGLEARLATSAWLFGATPALADMAIAPFVRQYASVDVDWFQSQPVPGVQRWLSAFLALPLFATVMQKYPVWKSGEAGILFPGYAD
ncbi:glutathione S-transferase [Neopusillimonas aromaticivorans]|uniref:glutathione S-transferase n=1 Tax=Neopusillimonas aromaticivorans TaxID=2979868 RepID=UPI002599C062|nr:glutathione S-transferase [Neopusillimonas aromaticivorans]WJJ92873.1 glutathione S-transferase [Neopusillimonas aromaticivorans]